MCLAVRTRYVGGQSQPARAATGCRLPASRQPAGSGPSKLKMVLETSDQGKQKGCPATGVLEREASHIFRGQFGAYFMSIDRLVLCSVVCRSTADVCPSGLLPRCSRQAERQADKFPPAITPQELRASGNVHSTALIQQAAERRSPRREPVRCLNVRYERWSFRFSSSPVCVLAEIVSPRMPRTEVRPTDQSRRERKAFQYLAAISLASGCECV